MPTYDYRCNSCGHVFEELQSIKADPLKDCPKCHKPELVRLLAGGAGMIFKGSGFYLTDYAKGGSKSAGPSKGSSETKTPPSSSGSSADSTSS
jgi:putative FmdB family regulatory protein